MVNSEALPLHKMAEYVVPRYQVQKLGDTREDKQAFYRAWDIRLKKKGRVAAINRKTTQNQRLHLKRLPSIGESIRIGVPW